MDPLSLLFFALLVGTGAAIVVSILTWTAIDEFVQLKVAKAGSAEIIRRRLSSGRYEVVAGVFSATGAKAASQRWDAGEIDQDLSRRFGAKNVIKIKT